MTPTEAAHVKEQRDALLASVATLREALGKHIMAADCIQHWHDTGRENEGMIVSSRAVRLLWQATKDARAALANPATVEALERVRREAKIEVLTQFADEIDAEIAEELKADPNVIEGAMAVQALRDKAAALRGGQ
jgi:hypothetical protein